MDKYCTDWLCLAAEKCKSLPVSDGHMWCYLLTHFMLFFNTVGFIFIVFDRGYVVCMKYVNQMFIVYLYADKLEPCVIPRVELYRNCEWCR